MKKPAKDLTATQRRWLSHLQSCRTGSHSIPEYARRHQLSAPQLYTWRSRLRRLGALDGVAEARGRPERSRERTRSHPVPQFSPVRLVELSEAKGVGMRIRFANGIILELDGTTVPAPDLLTALASLR